FASVRTFCQAFEAEHDALNVLVNNVGTNAHGNITEDGLELYFQSNTARHVWIGQAILIQLRVFDSLGLRRHAVGTGITPVDHRSDAHEIASTTAPTLLYLGLPDSLLDELQRTDPCAEDDTDRPWKLAARRGFHPVFDAGVEQLMLVIDGNDDGATTGSLSTTSELWELCSPRYATEHYSSNAGVEKMLDCVRRAKEIYEE
ncbi:hypothetical protein ACHAWF_000637, partial [Thalassiosira exigua]